MQDIPEITKRNFKKVLKELDVAKFPSFNLNIYLKTIRDKLAKKEKLLFSEEQLSFFKFKKYLEDCKQEFNRYYVSKMNFSRFSHRPPLSFQEEGIKFLLANERCILADETGIGKSVQAVIAALSLPEDYKILIVTTKSLKYNFKKEIEFYSDSFKVIEKTWETGYKFTLIHYDSLKKWKKEIIQEKFDCVISDESHLICNTRALRSKNFFELTKDKSLKKLWLLTGTPITNRPYNYFNLLKLIKHPLAKNWRTFVMRYCAGYKDHFERWVTDGSSNEQELYEKTKGSVLRRLKKDHLKELPNKDRQPIFLQLNDWKGYNQVIKDYENKKLANLIEEFGSISETFEDGVEINAMTKLILWRQFCALEKIRDGSLFELISNHLDQDNKIVVFTNFTSVVDAVYAHFGSAVCSLLDGRIGDAEERLRIVEEFNNSSTLKVFVLNLQVGSVGLNIQSANIGIINDMYWVPGTMLQAEDRLWRIGQTREVTILYPVYEDTVETIMYKIVDNKMKTISEIVEGKKESYFDSNEETVKVNSKDSILKEIFAQFK